MGHFVRVTIPACSNLCSVFPFKHCVVCDFVEKKKRAFQRKKENSELRVLARDELLLPPAVPPAVPPSCLFSAFTSFMRSSMLSPPDMIVAF